MPTSLSSRAEVVRAYLLLPHATPILAVLAGTAAFAFLARGGWPGWSDLAMLLLAMFGGQIVVGAVNELVDVELDRIGRPDKPLVSGLVSVRGARVMVLAGIALMILGSTRFSLLAFSLCALGTGLGVAYSFWFKRTPWSWVPYVLAIPLIPIWVWTALETVPDGLVAVYPVAVPGLVALQLAQSIPDIEADRRMEVRTLAVLLAARVAIRATRWLVALSALLAGGLAVQLLEQPVFALGSGGGAIALMLAEAVWPPRDERQARLRLFPVVVLAVGMIGVGWALALVAA